MINSKIHEYAYNAVFGGIHCDEFYFFTIPALLTIIVGLIVCVHSVIKGNSVYTLGESIGVIFGIGFISFFIDIVILYVNDPQENGIILNILAFIILGSYVAFCYFVIVIVPFALLSILLFFSHDIYILKRYITNRNKITRLLYDKNLSNEDMIEKVVEALELRNGFLTALCVKKLSVALDWEQNHYKGIDYYGVFVNAYFNERNKIYIDVYFDDACLSIVKNCRNDFHGFDCIKTGDGSASWKLRYVIYLNNKNVQRDVVLNEIKIVTRILGIDKRIHF